MTQPSLLHLVHRANLPSQALVAHGRAVVPHPSPVQALAPALPSQALVLHIVLHVPAAHFLQALSHHRVLASPAHAAALRLAIRPLAQAAPVLLFQAHLVVLLVLAALRLASHHLAPVLHPVIQPSLPLVPLAPPPLAVHLHLRVRASRYYKASISIRIALKAAGLLRWSVLALRHTLEWIMAYSDLDCLVKVDQMILMASKAVMMPGLTLDCQIQFFREKR